MGEDSTGRGHADEQKEHEAAIGRLQGEHDRLRHRLHAMYVDKLDGRIDGTFYTQMSEQWRTEQDKIAREIARHQAADRSYLQEGAKLIELAHGAQRLFSKEEAQEQRRLLNFVLSNSIWKEGELTAIFLQPFNLIAEATAGASGEEGRRRPKRRGIRLGWGTWIRTKTNRVRVCCATVTPFPTEALDISALFSEIFQSEPGVFQIRPSAAADIAGPTFAV